MLYGHFGRAGILYSHRNEDIVNVGPSIKKLKESTDQKSTVSEDVKPIKRADRRDKEENRSMEQKRVQYRLIACFVGMEEIEFSKWVLSATPGERETVLRDYKKRKVKVPNG